MNTCAPEEWAVPVIEDTKGAIRIPTSKNYRQHNGQKKQRNRTKMYSKAVNGRIEHTMTNKKWTKGQAIIYKVIHRKLKIEQQEPQ
jgi:hypothetical protein